MDKNKFLLGSIDTRDEAMIILNLLQQINALKFEVDKIDIDLALENIKNIRSGSIIGSVDTPREVELFLKYLRRHGILQSPVDTPEEIRLFMKMLEREGFFTNSLLTARNFKSQFFKNPVEFRKLKRPRPRQRPTEDEEDE